MGDILQSISAFFSSSNAFAGTINNIISSIEKIFHSIIGASTLDVMTGIGAIFMVWTVSKFTGDSVYPWKNIASKDGANRPLDNENTSAIGAADASKQRNSFDTFDSIDLPHASIPSRRQRLLFHITGTTASLLETCPYHEKRNRAVLGALLAMVVTLSFLSACLFLKTSLSGEGDITPSISVTILGAILYGCFIYLYDFSIINNVDNRFAVILFRVVITTVLSISITGPILIMFFKPLVDDLLETHGVAVESTANKISDTQKYIISLHADIEKINATISEKSKTRDCANRFLNLEIHGELASKDDMKECGFQQTTGKSNSKGVIKPKSRSDEYNNMHNELSIEIPKLVARRDSMVEEEKQLKVSISNLEAAKARTIIRNKQSNLAEEHRVIIFAMVHDPLGVGFIPIILFVIIMVFDLSVVTLKSLLLKTPVYDQLIISVTAHGMSNSKELAGKFVPVIRSRDDSKPSVNGADI